VTFAQELQTEHEEDEADRAYWGWWSKYPPRDLSPRPTDGTRLALSIRKLTDGFFPDRPFLICGIGPSYLNMLGDGTALTHELCRFDSLSGCITGANRETSLVDHSYNSR
jgi:hypothetical protein